MARATRLTTSTNRVRMKAPAQASECQLSYGLIAYWKITTGTLAIGARTSVVQYWLLSAVNSSGAVSPEMRASASRSEERRVGQEGVSTCRSRGSPSHEKKKNRKTVKEL